MHDIFLNVLDASLHGGIVILAVLVLRLILRKAPRKYTCLLWILVGLRLLVPFSVESKLSLQPREQAVTESEWQDLRDYGQILPEDAPMDTQESAIPAKEEAVSEDEMTGEPDPDVTVTVAYEINWAELVPYLWLAGACGLGIYSLISYLRLKRRVREAVILSGGVWECAELDTAFILGYLRPRIYIPMGLSETNRCFILAHERAHLKRGDHWFKLIGFAALAVHWFNPLVWVAYVLLCKDIEMACDEYVVRDMALEERKSYSAALLSCSAGRRSVAACPVAFGEVSVKERIKSVLNYRRPRFWISLMAVAAVIFVAVCFLTNPASEEQDLSFLNYENAISLAAEQDVLYAVHYTPEDEGDYIGIGMVEGEALAEYLDSAEWSEKWFEPSDKSSPGSVAFNIAENLRITVYDRRFAAVQFNEEVRYYRTGKDDYEKAVEMLLPPDEERLERSAEQSLDLVLGMAVMEDADAPDWGITVSVFNVTATGLTFRIDQSGEVVFPQYLFYGQEYSLEVWNGTGWESVEPIIENWGFTTEAILLSKGQKTDLSIDWEWLYGELPAGEYRIGKTIRREKDGEDWDSYTYYASFRISDAVGKGASTEQKLLEKCRDALEAFQAQNSYHISWVSNNSTEVILNTYSEGSMWRNGADWYRECYYPDVNDGSVDMWLERDSVQYARSYGNNSDGGGSYDTGWVQRDLLNEAGELWVRTFDWDAADIRLESQKKDNDGITITCRIEGGINTEDLDSLSNTMLEFRLDNMGTMLSVTRTDSFDGDPGIWVQTVTIHRSDSGEIDGVIEEKYEEVTWNYYAEFERSGTVGQTLEAFFRNDCPVRMTPEEILLLDYDEQFALVFYSGEGPVLKFCRYLQEGEEIRITGVCEGGYTLSGGLSINCLELDGNYIYFGTVSDSHFDPGDDTAAELEWSKLRLTDAGGATTELDMTGRQGYFCILEEPLADFQVIDTNHVVCLDYARYTQQGYAIDAVDTWQTE